MNQGRTTKIHSKVYAGRLEKMMSWGGSQVGDFIDIIKEEMSVGESAEFAAAKKRGE